MDIIVRKNFIIKKEFIGQNKLIQFKDIDGIRWELNHDEIYTNHKERFDGLKCFHDYGYYINTKKIPKFVLDKGIGYREV